MVVETTHVESLTICEECCAVLVDANCGFSKESSSIPFPFTVTAGSTARFSTVVVVADGAANAVDAAANAATTLNVFMVRCV